LNRTSNLAIDFRMDLYHSYLTIKKITSPAVVLIDARITKDRKPRQPPTRRVAIVLSNSNLENQSI